MMDIYDKEKAWQAQETCKRSNGWRIAKWGDGWVPMRYEDRACDIEVCNCGGTHPWLMTHGLYPTFGDALSITIEILETT